MKVHHHAPLTGPYALVTLPPIAPAGAAPVLVGLVRFAAGTRSPEIGMRTSAKHELGYVVSGRLRIDTEHASFEACAGNMLSSSPTEPHSTTALEDSEIFFVLIDPHLAGQA
jgi:quercetin dioxygenase-like cupin family protein